MSEMLINQYAPDYVSPPGDTLLDVLEERGMPQAELARRMGRPAKTINEIIHSKTSITPETALQLERVLNIPAAFWNSREQHYRQHLARVEEFQSLSRQAGWTQNFPLREMIRLGWIEAVNDEVQQFNKLLHFFGIASPQQWEGFWKRSLANYRKADAFESSPYSLSAWLRQGERKAQQIYCAPYQINSFRQLLTGRIRSLTQLPPEQFQETLVNLCAEAGVAVIFVPQIQGARVSGATRWLSPRKALIQLSLRYKKDDHFWFTFFHEAGHIILHGKRDVFLETDDHKNKKEQEANDFAASTLIPPEILLRFVQQHVRPNHYPSRTSVQQFARKIGVSPGVVVGRLQHDRLLPFTHLNGLKRTFAWAE